MKHNLYIIVILILLFLNAHIIGLFIVKNYLPKEKQLPLGIEKPELKEKTSYLPIILSLILATIVSLILIKFRAIKIWRTWFLISVFFALAIAFGAFLSDVFAIILALIFAIFKTFKPNFFVHNFTELFIYGGLAGIFVPVLNIFSIIMLLLLVSIYDMIAVWKTKHMISMAKFQTKSRMFAGLFVSYKSKNLAGELGSTKKINRPVHREAILGGGDIAFPLLFSGVIMKNFGFLPALLTSMTAAIALLFLLLLANKKKFYPAMPFLTLGSFVGYLILLAL